MENRNLQEHKWMPKSEFVPFLGDDEKLDKKQIGKIELFEAGLKNEIKRSDPLDFAIKKIVRMALAAEFSPSFVKSKGADEMIETITKGIVTDNTLRKQALFIVDKF